MASCKIQTYQNKAKNLCTIYFVFDLDGECKFIKTKHCCDKRNMFFLAASAATLVGWIGDFVYRKVTDSMDFWPVPLLLFSRGVISVVIGGSSQASLWNEARKAEVWGPKGWKRALDIWGGAASPPPHQLRGLVSAVSSPSGVMGEATETVVFGAFQGLNNQVTSTFYSWFCRFQLLELCKKIILQSLGVHRPFLL